MDVIKEALITGILLAGIVNSIYGVPFVGAYSMSGNRGPLYWTVLFLLGNSSAYFFILILGLWEGTERMELIGQLRPLFALIISISSFFIGLIILLTALTLSKFLLEIMEKAVITGGVIYFLGFLMGFYLGRSAIGFGIYLGDMSLPKIAFLLASLLFAMGTFVSPLCIVAGLFRVFPRYRRTQGERRFWDVVASLLLFITSLGFFFWG